MHRGTLRSTVRITALYVLLGILWFAMSARLTTWLTLSQETETFFIMAKGWLFVALSAALIFCLVGTEINKTRRAEEMLRRNLRAHRVLSACNEALVRTHDEQQLLQEICDLIVEQGGYRLAWVGYIGDDPNKTVRPLASAGPARPYLDGISVSWSEQDEHGRGPTGTAIRTRQPVICQKMKSDPKFGPWCDRARKFDLASSIALPLVAGGRTLGALNIYSADEQAFDEQETRLLAQLADDLAYGIETVRTRLARQESVETIQRQLSRLAALRAIDLAITSSLDLRLTLKVLLEQVIEQLKVDAADVLLVDPYSNRLEYAGGRGFRTRSIETLSLAMGEGLAGRVALDRAILMIPDLSDESDTLQVPLLKDEQFVSYFAAPLITKGDLKGVLELFTRKPLRPDENWEDFLDALAAQAAIAVDNARLFESLTRSNAELVAAYDATIEGWARALAMRDYETEGHTRRVIDLTVRLARLMGMSEADLVHVRRGALLHDIGKMAISDEILLKPDRLDEREWEIMRKHPEFAFDLLAPVSFLKPALDIPYCHHERWDGTGYPRGLKGEQIPLAARVFAVVDVWDALTSDRPYRKAFSRDDALEYIRSNAGKHFDPRVVESFLGLIDDGKKA